MKLSERIDLKVILLIGIVLIGIAGFGFLTSTVIQAERSIEKTKLNIQKEYLRRDRYEELLSLYQEIAAEGLLDELKVQLPSTDNFLDVVEEIDTIAHLSGNGLVMRLGDTRLTTDGFEIDADELVSRTTSSLNYDVVEIELALRGDYKQLQQFLNLMKQARFYMNITAMNVNRIQSAASTDLDTHMTVNIFVQKLIVK